jgi:hypothetical protein
VAEIEEHRTRASEGAERAAKAIEEVEHLQVRLRVLEGDLVRSRKWVRQRVPAKNLEECQDQLTDADDLIEGLEQTLDLRKQLTERLYVAYEGTYDRAEQLERAWVLERDRAEGFKRQQKKEQVKKVFIGIGSGVGGALIGIGIGTVIN